MGKYYSPETEGEDHINIYSKSKLPLGRFLSNFAQCHLTIDGLDFFSVEAYWYWLSLRHVPDHETKPLRLSYGSSAKKLGQALREKFGQAEVMDFEGKIKEAIRQKLEKNPDMKKEFKESTLPFAHYYVFEDGVAPAGYSWLVKFFKDLRREYSNDNLDLFS